MLFDVQFCQKNVILGGFHLKTNLVLNGDYFSIIDNFKNVVLELNHIKLGYEYLCCTRSVILKAD